MKFAESIPADGPIAFVFGAFAVGKINPEDHPYVSIHNMTLYTSFNV